MAETPDVTVSHDAAAHRYEAVIDGQPAGLAAYREDDGRVVFTHTEVPSRWEGLGVGSRIAKAALDDVVASGRQIVPDCPFIARYIEEHPEYAEHVAAR